MRTNPFIYASLGLSHMIIGIPPSPAPQCPFPILRLFLRPDPPPPRPGPNSPNKTQSLSLAPAAERGRRETEEIGRDAPLGWAGPLPRSPPPFLLLLLLPMGVWGVQQVSDIYSRPLRSYI